MNRPYFITAIGTPLTQDEHLHEEGLKLQLKDQWNHGIDGILVAGTMGTMPLLTNRTYEQLIEKSVELASGSGEIIVGAGDTSFARTRDRIEFINRFKVDGVAVLAPYFWKLSQQELVEYYTALADVSKAPFYLYDLPQVIGTKLSMETILELAQHPNIKGAKLSGNITFTIPLIDAIGDKFRVIVAKPDLMDIAMHHGILEHLDGMWAITPKWAVQIGSCAVKGDWAGAAEHRRNLIEVRNLLSKYARGAFTNLMNVRGIPGCFIPRPFVRLNESQKDLLLNEPIVKKLIKEDLALGT